MKPTAEHRNRFPCSRYSLSNRWRQFGRAGFKPCKRSRQTSVRRRSVPLV
jgi:hypothetical protein